MTQEEFVAFYPQFTGFTPDIVLSTYVDQANARFGSFSDIDAEEARRLFTAHRLTLYARMALPDGVTPTRETIATAGQSSRAVASKKVGEVSVTYATGASASSVDTDFADLAETSFGLQLLSLLRLYSMTRYIP